ncbi:MAG TPA: S53 family peptidase [Streptosporangiaceae bacterium]|nr:S53 family peptidase [Streptosporangiaceae bacterium]
MPGKHMAASITGAALLLGLASMMAAGGASAAGRTHTGALVAHPLPDGMKLVEAGSQAPTDAFCRANFDSPCYSPQEIRHAYGVDKLVSRGYDGAGETIVIVDSFGSPTIAADLASFDAGYGLPAPPSFKIVSPLGTVPYNPTAIPDQVGWAAETTLDVEWSHAMAPDASIVLLTSPVDETEGVQGMPQFDAVENYALDHHLGQVISQSWGATENTLFTPAGQQVFRQFSETYGRAAAMGVTVLASTGDNGASNVEQDGTTFYPFPTVNFPASSPLVTAVGGTSLYADTNGDYQSETVWNSDGGASGGGISEYFREPAYQRVLPASDQRLLGGYRGVPDISWNADPNTPVLVYLSFLGASNAGYYTIGGTSEGSPDWAGLVADLDQLAGHPLGLLNPYVYALGAAGIGFHDITVGNNSENGVTGYSATPGWDAASGWGTPDLGQFVRDIAFLAHGNPSERTILARAKSLRR